MTRIDLHPEELLERAARGVASADEAARLSAHLAQCAACRFELALAEDCRRDAAPRADDAAVVGRIQASVRGALAGRQRRLRRASALGFRKWALLSVAAILMVGTVGAATTLFTVDAPAPAPAPAVERGTPPPARAIAVRPSPPRVAESAREPPPASEPHPSPAVVAGGAKGVTPVSPPREGPLPPVEADAAELFSRANASRRRGATVEAVRAYRDLARAFPGSQEHLVSRVALGRLLLDRLSDAKSALVEFDGYLAQAPRGALAEEAVVGRALSLGRLGRAAEERGAWSRLLSEHPRSTYGARARDRIALLDAK